MSTELYRLQTLLQTSSCIIGMATLKTGYECLQPFYLRFVFMCMYVHVCACMACVHSCQQVKRVTGSWKPPNSKTNLFKEQQVLLNVKYFLVTPLSF